VLIVFEVIDVDFEFLVVDALLAFVLVPVQVAFGDALVELLLVGVDIEGGIALVVDGVKVLLLLLDPLYIRFSLVQTILQVLILSLDRSRGTFSSSM
jgi:hypothetical protein